MSLKEFTVRIPDEEGIIAAAKVDLPAGEEIAWSTLIKFEDSIDCFMTVNRTYVPLQNGRTIQDCYNGYIGKLSFKEKRSASEFVIYAYRTLIDGCAVGTRMSFRDCETGELKNLRTYWNYSVSVLDPSSIKNEIAAAPDGKITVDAVSRMMRERCNLQMILEGVILDTLETVPFREVKRTSTAMGEKVINEFVKSDAITKTGFQLKAVTLGNIELTD